MNQKTIQEKIEALKSKNVSLWTDKDWEIHGIAQDLITLERLKELPRDTRIYTILRHVSSSGMSRIIDMFYVENGEPVKIHFATNKVFGTKRGHYSNGDGYKVSGCGMDMGYELVCSLGDCVEADGYYFTQEWI